MAQALYPLLKRNSLPLCTLDDESCEHQKWRTRTYRYHLARCLSELECPYKLLENYQHYFWRNRRGRPDEPPCTEWMSNPDALCPYVGKQCRSTCYNRQPAKKGKTKI